MLALIRPSNRSVPSLQICFKSLSISSVQYKNDEKPSGLVQKVFDYSLSRYRDLVVQEKQRWSERKAIRNAKRFKGIFKENDEPVDTFKRFQGFTNFPLSFKDASDFIKRRRFRNMVLEQQFMPKRHAILKPDLAATHFILRRGGSVKFVSKNFWVGPKGKNIPLPTTYVPGFYIEAIDAENTSLYYEGFKNLCSLSHLKWLSLKGLDEVDDWCMDYVSNEYSNTLEYLDLTDCKNVTYRGLSCFYRFENLKTLVVQGVPDGVEFKLACIMLQDIMPELDIQGISLNIPEKIEPVENVDVPLTPPKLEKEQHNLKT